MLALLRCRERVYETVCKTFTLGDVWRQTAFMQISWTWPYSYQLIGWSWHLDHGTELLAHLSRLTMLKSKFAYWRAPEYRRIAVLPIGRALDLSTRVLRHGYLGMATEEYAFAPSFRPQFIECYASSSALQFAYLIRYQCIVVGLGGHGSAVLHHLAQRGVKVNSTQYPFILLGSLKEASLYTTCIQWSGRTH